MLLKQSFDEVLNGTLERDRLQRTLERLSQLEVCWQNLELSSPLSFPLFAGMGVGTRISNESMEMKVSRLKQKWEKQSEAQA